MHDIVDPVSGTVSRRELTEDEKLERAAILENAREREETNRKRQELLDKSLRTTDVHLKCLLELLFPEGKV